MSILQHNYELVVKKYTDERIKDFVQQRCVNFTDAKGKMISSFLDCQGNTIILDRILIQKDGDGQLTTDPDIMMEETNRYFQNCAGGSNEEKIIPSSWQTQYQPKTGIDIKRSIWIHIWI